MFEETASNAFRFFTIIPLWKVRPRRNCHVGALIVIVCELLTLTSYCVSLVKSPVVKGLKWVFTLKLSLKVREFYPREMFENAFFTVLLFNGLIPPRFLIPALVSDWTTLSAKIARFVSNVVSSLIS